MNSKSAVLPAFSDKYPLIVLRILLGMIFLTHGTGRWYISAVPGLAAFLKQLGIPFGGPLAWIVTIGELVGGVLLICGYKVRYCVLFHAAVITTGIFTAHLPRGWFVVGLSGGGVEYSFLILAALAVVYSRAES